MKKIIIYKSKKILEFYEHEKKLHELPIGLGAKMDHKETEGDHRTPEGEYEILVKNPKSDHYLSLGLSYPNKVDAKNGFVKGVISESEYKEICSLLDSGKGTLWNTALGGKVYIHGGLELTKGSRGCICLFNDDIQKLYEAVEIGTRVSICP